jgi:hypothetical protein
MKSPRRDAEDPLTSCGSYETGVFLSTNNRANRTAASNGLSKNGVVYYQILALAASGTNLFAGTYGGGIYISANKVTSWTAVNAGLTRTKIRALAVKGTYLFAGGDSTGVLRRPPR